MGKFRFLCLHGGGTSAKIFETQLAPLANELAKDNIAEFFFLDAPLESRAAPGIAGIFPGPFYSFYMVKDTYSDEDLEIIRGSFGTGLEFVDKVVGENGPFDGILGFSQGANIAFAYLQERARTHPFGPTPFTCAAFFGASFVRSEEPSVTIPTLHVVSPTDPWYQQSIAMQKLCEQRNSQTIVHDRGHAIPRDRKNLMAMKTGFGKLAERAVFGG